MARESVFARNRKTGGHNWYNETSSDKLFNMVENILNDVAFGNVYSDEDKWTLVSDPISNAIISFCDYRLNNMNYVLKCIMQYREICAQFGGGGDNEINAPIFFNIKSCVDFYTNVKMYIEGYKSTLNPSYMIAFCNLCANNKKYINPNKFM